MLVQDDVRGLELRSKERTCIAGLVMITAAIASKRPQVTIFVPSPKKRLGVAEPVVDLLQIFERDAAMLLFTRTAKPSQPGF